MIPQKPGGPETLHSGHLCKTHNDQVWLEANSVEVRKEQGSTCNTEVPSPVQRDYISFPLHPNAILRKGKRRYFEKTEAALMGSLNFKLIEY